MACPEECREYFQLKLKEHEDEVDIKVDKVEGLVTKTVDKLNDTIVALTVVTTQLSSVPQERHTEEHSWLKSRIKKEETRTKFYQALTLSLASRLGWKLIIVLIATLVAGVWHHDQIMDWIFNNFLNAKEK